MSITTIVFDEIPTKTVKAVDIKRGTVFTGRIGTNDNRLFKKTYGGVVVALDKNDNGYSEWNSNPEIDDYREVDIEIRIL